MKRDVVVNRQHAQLRVEDGHLDYGRDGAPPVVCDFEIRETQPGSYWVRLGDRSYRVLPGPDGTVVVNGRTISMEVFDPRERPSAESGAASHGRQQITSPMPGKIVRVLVDVNMEVTEGQGLVVVEAMKMQNEMKSPKSGVVREVRVRADATVSAGEILVVIE